MASSSGPLWASSSCSPALTEKPPSLAWGGAPQRRGGGQVQGCTGAPDPAPPEVGVGHASLRLPQAEGTQLVVPPIPHPSPATGTCIWISLRGRSLSPSWTRGPPPHAPKVGRWLRPRKGAGNQFLLV